MLHVCTSHGVSDMRGADMKHIPAAVGVLLYHQLLSIHLKPCQLYHHHHHVSKEG